MNWNEIENIALKFHKMFKGSEKILEVVRVAKIAENNIISIKNEESKVIKNIDDLKTEERDLKGNVSSLKKGIRKLNDNYKTKNDVVVKLASDIDSGCASHKAKMTEELKNHESECQKDIEDAGKKYHAKIAEMDKELERKQKMIDAANKTLETLKSKLG